MITIEIKRFVEARGEATVASADSTDAKMPHERSDQRQVF
jgi:hypothetical protein